MSMQPVELSLKSPTSSPTKQNNKRKVTLAFDNSNVTNGHHPPGSHSLSGDEKVEDPVKFKRFRGSSAEDSIESSRSRESSITTKTSTTEVDQQLGGLKRVVSVGTFDRLRSLEEGEENTLDYRVHSLDDNSNRISIWHEVNLHSMNPNTNKPTGNYNFICEIPKFTRKKYEISTSEPFNPIKQDTKNGILRSFSKGDIFFNYGCFPRTWEDPNYVHPALTVGGDNDPLDVCEIGLQQIQVGQVREVKILGVLCLIDDGEADWKIIAIDAQDRWANELNDIDDVERLLPGILDSIHDWFRTYKTYDGKPENKFGFDGKFQTAAFAKEIIRETHIAWKELCVSNKKKSSENILVSKLSVPNFQDLDYSLDMIAVTNCLGEQPSSISTVESDITSKEEDHQSDEQDIMIDGGIVF